MNDQPSLSLAIIAEQIRIILQESQSKGAEAISRILVEAYWTIGRILTDNAQTALSDESLAVLSADTGLERTTLGRCAAFYQTWPAICPAKDNPKLTWSHYKLLLPLPAGERDYYLKNSAEQDLSVRELSQSIKDNAFAAAAGAEPKAAPVLKRRDNRLHIYKTTIVHVADGDTIVVDIDLGFDVWVKKRIRLRGIDCAEAGTPDGEKATAYTMNALPLGSTVVIQTFMVDLHGRFVADVFYLPEETDKEKILADGRFLNQELLNEKLADLI